MRAWRSKGEMRDHDFCFCFFRQSGFVLTRIFLMIACATTYDNPRYYLVALFYVCVLGDWVCWAC
jgi:hypothetical protein